MKTVDSFVHLQDAQLARAFLEGHGVEADLPGENAVQTVPLYSAKHGIRLQVAEEDYDMACELMKIFHADARDSGPHEDEEE